MTDPERIRELEAKVLRRTRALREKFDALLIAEVNFYNGIPDITRQPYGKEQLALREAVAELLALTAPSEEAEIVRGIQA